MSDQDIIAKLNEMREHYDEGWTLYDLQNDLEDIFMALAGRQKEA